MRHRLKAVPAAFVIAVLAAFFGLSATALADAPATVTIDPPTEVGYTTVHVSGTVNPEGGPSPTYWHFEYSTEPANPESWLYSTAWGEFSGPAAEGTSPVAVEGTMEYLQPGTEYAVRLVAENGEFTNRSVTEAPYPTFTTEPVPPPTVSIDAPTAVTTTTAHFSGEIDPEAPAGNPAAFDVNWRFECTPECPGLSGGSIPADSSSHEVKVEADAAGLVPGVSYEVVLVAENAGGPATAGPEGFTTQTEAPEIEKVSAHPLFTEATLKATFNPEGLATTYHFEYGATASYGQTTPEQMVPAGGQPVTVAAVISGLNPGSEYHYRFVADNADGTAEGSDRTFVTHTPPVPDNTCPNVAIQIEQGSIGLPDCRAYEMVSPSVKNMGEAITIYRAADEGGAVAFAVNAGIPGATGVHYAANVVARRSADGWTLQSVDPPGEPFSNDHGAELLAVADFDPSFSQMLVGSEAPLTADDSNESGNELYGVNLSSGAITWLSQPQGGSSIANDIATYGAASRDLTRVYWKSDASRLPGAPTSALYESRNGELRLVSVLPDGTPSEGRTAADAGGYSGIDSSITGGMAVAHGGAHTVSDDGSSVFWTSASAGAGEIFLSRDGQRTVEITASQRTGEEGAKGQGRFIAATHDASVAYFVSPSQLTDGATTANELYRYETATGDLTLLTPNSIGGTGAQVVNATPSDDGSHIYFTAEGALTPEAEEGALNAYVWSGGEVRLIATLGVVQSGATPKNRFVRVTRDGSQALLETPASLDGADNNGYTAVYAYRDPSGELACVSCRPDGSPSEGAALLEAHGALSNLGINLHRTRNQTDDGRVFFMSEDQLVPADVNSVFDVYEWDDGRISLLSNGRSDFDTYLGDNSDNGRDVFIITQSRLVASDTDGSYDVYDVRVDGGFPASAPPVDCQEEDCQGPSAAGPRFDAPASEGFKGSRKVRRAARPVLRWVHRPSSSDRVALASGKQALLRLKVNRPGRVAAAGVAKIEGKRARVISASVTAKKPGGVKLPISLSKPALSELERQGALRVRVAVRFRSAAVKRLSIVLRAPSDRKGGAR